MAEFAGYIGANTPPTDWGKIGRDFTDRLITLNEQRKVEQEKLDDIQAEAYAKLGDIEATSSQSLNQLFMDHVVTGRDSLNTLYDQYKKGLITKATYKRGVMTLQTDTSVLNKIGKNYAQNSELVLKAIPKASGYGRWKATQFSNVGDLSTKKTMISPDTQSVYIADIDPATGGVKAKSSLASVATIANMSNFLPDEKIDLLAKAGEIKKGLGSSGVIKYNEDGSSYVLDTPANKKGYQEILNSQVRATLSSPDDIASILSDYGDGYSFYRTDSEKKKLLDEGYDEKKLVPVQTVNGRYTPEFSEDQVKAAQDLVYDHFNNAIDTKITGRQAAPKKPGDDLSESDKKLQAMLLTAGEGWADIVRNGDKSKYVDDLLQMGGNLGFANGDFVPIPMKGGGFAGFKLYSNDGRLIKEVRSQGDLVDLITYNPEKPIESKANKKMAIDSLKKSGKYVTLTEINNLPEASRGGLSVTEYANWLRSQNYYIADE